MFAFVALWFLKPWHLESCEYVGNQISSQNQNEILQVLYKETYKPMIDVDS